MLTKWQEVGKFPFKGRARSLESLILLGIVWAYLSSVWIHGLALSETSASEYEVKAVFLYHFTRYMQWPEEKKPDVFSVVVFGESTIIAPLQEIARKKRSVRSPLWSGNVSI
jgi:hypothetical protein